MSFPHAWERGEGITEPFQHHILPKVIYKIRWQLNIQMSFSKTKVSCLKINVKRDASSLYCRRAVTFSHCFFSFSTGWRETIFLRIISWSPCSRVWIVRALFHAFWGRQTRSLHQPLQDTSGQYLDYGFSLNLDNPSKPSMSPFE